MKKQGIKIDLMMRIKTVLFLSLIMASSAQAQRKDSIPVPSQNKVQYDYYMSKSKSASTTGGILIGAGGLLMIIGVVQMNTYTDDIVTDVANAFTGVGAAVAGGTLMIASIPFFARSSRFKRDAQLLLSLDSARIPALPSGKSLSQLTLTIKF